MKHFNKLFLVVALFVTMGLHAQNLLVNGDFESWVDDNTPTGWTHVEGITKEADTDSVHGGSFSAKHSATGSTTDLGQLITGITPGKSYTLTVWYKVDINTGDGTDARIWSKWSKDGVNDNATDADVLQGPDGGYFDNNGGVWSTYSTTVIAPATANEFYFEVRVYGTAVVYWDDFSFVEIANGAPSISNITLSPAQDITASDAVTVSATITDDGELDLTKTGLLWGTASGQTINPVFMTNGGSGDVFTGTIPAQTAGSTIYFVVGAQDTEGEISASTEMMYKVYPFTGSLPFTEEFNSDLGGFYTYSVSGDTKKWYYTNGYAAANGYNSGDEEIDYLITPGFDLTGTSDEVISYKTWRKYGVESDADNFLKLYYSTDYAGLGDPSTASWTEVTGATFPSLAESETWTKTEDVDVSMADGNNVHFAFVYKYQAGNYVSWEVDSVVIKENPDNAIQGLTSSVGVASYAKDNLKIFSDASYDIAVYSLSGMKVKEFRNVSRQVNVTDLTKGVYMVTLEDANGARAVRKFIKE
ncbi:choice-of-anchor J domain-containing protein [Saccharicrinis sp. FJH62]|uniref:choice-of-anchor J domain-containing protein n=1 Tax=Saccharicrinis sp. FJH62 TaxID=3344657 RepID=UPI0035D4B37C